MELDMDVWCPYIVVERGFEKVKINFFSYLLEDLENEENPNGLFLITELYAVPSISRF